MCVVLVCPENVRPSIETLLRCQQANPHGGGVAWRRNGAVEWVKTNDLDEIHALCQKVKGELIIHFRIASVGAVCNELRHPFPITPRAQVDERGRTNAVLFQNGTWSGWRDALEKAKAKGHTMPEGPMSDTRAAAFLCAVQGHRFLKTLTPSRWVYFSARETATFGNWFKREGIYFSNLFWMPRDKETPAAPKKPANAKPEPAAKVHAPKPERESLELWDMSSVANYWSKLAPKRSK